MTAPLSPSAAIDEATHHLTGQSVYLVGSCAAAFTYNRSEFHDVDLFVPTQQVLISTITTLLHHDYLMDDRFERVWQRWLRYGLKGWHTNSMRLHSPQGVETNVVFKKVDGHPTTSLAQVVESFDFGLLATGFNLEFGTYHDFRSALFPGHDIDGPLPLMPNKRNNWRNGFVSQYNGLREAARYAKYYGYGHDMSAVKDDLALGYRMVASYHATSADQDKQLLSQIYTVLAERITLNQIDELVEAYRTLEYKDPLEEILDALE